MKKIKKPVSVLLSLIMIFALFAIVPVTASAATQNVTFIGEDGSPQSVTATILNNNDNLLPGGWYVLNRSITLNSTLQFSNSTDEYVDVNLILRDGCTLYLKNSNTGIELNSKMNLNIYAESTNGTGAIESSSYKTIELTDNNATLNVYGGNITATDNENAHILCCGDVTATGGSGCAGIGLGVGGVTVNIYDADVTATGGENAAAIGGQGGTITVNVNSGKVTATESNINVEKIVAGGVFDQEDAEKAKPAGIGAVLGDATIHLGWNNANSDSIYADSYGGTVTLLKKFKDKNNTSTVFDTGVLSDPAAIAGITLIPSCEHPVWSEPVWEFSWDADNNRANATATFTCTTCGEQEVKGDDYYEVHQYSSSDDGYYRTYTFSTTFNETEYISPAATFARHLDISVSGVYIDKDNCGDVLGDGGKVKYDLATNTLTLNNATIQLMNTGTYTSAYGISFRNYSPPLLQDHRRGNIRRGYEYPGKLHLRRKRRLHLL